MSTGVIEVRIMRSIATLGFAGSLALLFAGAASPQLSGNSEAQDQVQAPQALLLRSYTGPFTDAEVSQHLKAKGSVALREGRYDEAAAHFGSALEFDDRDVWSYWQRCWALTELRQLSAAHIDCRAAIQLLEAKAGRSQNVADIVEDYVAVFAAYAKLLRVNGMPQKIVEEFRRLYQRKRVGPALQASDRLKMYLAHAYADLSKNQKALFLLDEVVRSDELSVAEIDAVLLLRANIYSRMDRNEDAIADYSRLSSASPNNAGYRYLLCAEYLSARHWADAEVSCASATRLAPERDLYELAHAISLFHNRKPEQALLILRRVEGSRPNSQFLKRYLLATEVLLGLTSPNEAASSLGESLSGLMDLIRAGSAGAE